MLKYFKSREFWLTLLAMVGVAVLGYVAFFFLFLPSYTNHGETTIVPEVTKIKLDEAIVKLEEVGLRYEVVDSLYLSGMPALAVISQDPTGISKVKPGRRIYLTVNKTVPPMVKLPEIVGVSQYQAKLRLEGANLTVGKMEYVPHEYKNLVIGAFYRNKRLQEGDTLPKFSKIDLKVGQGKGSQMVEIPELVGKHYQTAIATLHRLGLNVGSHRFVPESPQPAGTIIQQNPAYSRVDSIHLGSEVDLIIAGQQPPEALEGFSDGFSSDDTLNTGQ